MTATGSPSSNSPDRFLGYGVSVGSPSNGMTGSDASLPSGTADRTIAVWVRPDQSVSDDRYVFAYGTLSGTAWAALGLYLDGQWFYSNGGAAIFTTGATAVVGAPHLIVYTRTGGTEAMYVNGEARTPSGSAGGSTTLSAAYIGNAPYNPMSSTVFDARVYNRVLSAAEVARLYHPRTRWDLYREAAKYRRKTGTATATRFRRTNFLRAGSRGIA